MGTGRRTGEKPVLAPINEWPDGVLSRIVVWSQAAVFDVDNEPLPVVRSVGDSLAEQTFSGSPRIGVA